jgi:hypothetical protein
LKERVPSWRGAPELGALVARQGTRKARCLSYRFLDQRLFLASANRFRRRSRSAFEKFLGTPRASFAKQMTLTVYDLAGQGLPSRRLKIFFIVGVAQTRTPLNDPRTSRALFRFRLSRSLALQVISSFHSRIEKARWDALFEEVCTLYLRSHEAQI